MINLDENINLTRDAVLQASNVAELVSFVKHALFDRLQIDDAESGPDAVTRLQAIVDDINTLLSNSRYSMMHVRVSDRADNGIAVAGITEYVSLVVETHTPALSTKVH